MPKANWEKVVGYVEEDKNNLTQRPQSEGNDAGSSPVTSTTGTRNRLQIGMMRWLCTKNQRATILIEYCQWSYFASYVYKSYHRIYINAVVRVRRYPNCGSKEKDVLFAAHCYSIISILRLAMSRRFSVISTL